MRSLLRSTLAKMLPRDSGDRRRLGRTAHDKTGRSISLHQQRGSQGDASPVEDQLDGKEAPTAPAGSLARMRKQVLDRVARKDVSVVEACRDAGWSRSRFYELRASTVALAEVSS